MPPRFHLPQFPHAAKALSLGLTSLVPWIPAYVLFLDNVASVKKVSGNSMSPAFCPNPTEHDWVLAKHWGARENLERGQVVLYRSPVDPEREVIKRIVALEGDIVRTRLPYPTEFVKVPRGQAWMEGDEAFHSIDSNTYGAVPVALITSKITHILYPFSRAGKVAQDERLSRPGVLYRRAAPKERIAVFGL
ncbi:peptidase S24/S26A/S26B/S26C [Sphaerosporella brunnea]|uniref:Mitochondrial inner membrane protease subunit 2 n=1 Tax=Sphaerosporella brunnea TaxID=1250544 RepID=A0A5J5EJN0_9PEZI|nr:peptidase S24/S26A/S26B/S26C [Sphaerosporella brunnea]